MYKGNEYVDVWHVILLLLFLNVKMWSSTLKPDRS